MLLAIWDGGDWQDLARMAAIGVVAYVVVLWVAALVWTYRDVAARTSDTFLQTLALVFVLVFNIPGLLIYLVLRPKDTLMDAYDRQLEAEALLHEIQEQATCPRCRRKVDADFIACPYCRTSLRTACGQCGRPLTESWVLCPYCRAEASRPAPPAAATTDRAVNVPAAPPELPARVKRASTATYTPPASAPAAADGAPETRS